MATVRKPKKNNITSNLICKALKHWDVIVITIAVSLFILQTTFFALRIRTSIVPDEGYHISLSTLYSETMFKLQNSEQTYPLGEVNRRPYLYHWTAGRVINIADLLNVNTIYSLRMVNVCFLVATMYVAYRICKHFTKDKLVTVLTTLLLTNTLMLSFISSGVTYDPLINLLSALTFLYMLKFIKHKKAEDLLKVLMVFTLGLLTKYSYIPIVVITLPFLGYHVLKNRKALAKQAIGCLSNKKRLIPSIILSLIILFTTVLNAELHIQNIIKYKKMSPDCKSVIGIENCIKNPSYAAELSLVEIAPPKNTRMTLDQYLPQWFNLMERRIYGIFGHTSMDRPPNDIFIYNVLFLIGICLLIRNSSFRKATLNYLFFITLGYSGVLLVYRNYNAYLINGIVHAGVQGRYIFPVIIPLYFIFSTYYLSAKNKVLRILMFILICYVFIKGNIPFFFENDTANWYFKNETSLLEDDDSLYISNAFIYKSF